MMAGSIGGKYGTFWKSGIEVGPLLHRIPLSAVQAASGPERGPSPAAGKCRYHIACSADSSVLAPRTRSSASSKPCQSIANLQPPAYSGGMPHASLTPACSACMQQMRGAVRTCLCCARLRSRSVVGALA